MFGISGLRVKLKIFSNIMRFVALNFSFNPAFSHASANTQPDLTKLYLFKR